MTTTITALPTTTADVILDRAAHHLIRYGWTPLGLYEAHRNCPLKCRAHRTGGYPASILGAIRCAVFGAPRWYLDTAEPADLHTYTAAVEWLNTYLIAIGHAGQHATVFDWQTAPGRTATEVCEALQIAADAYRRHERRAAA